MPGPRGSEQGAWLPLLAQGLRGAGGPESGRPVLRHLGKGGGHGPQPQAGVFQGPNAGTPRQTHHPSAPSTALYSDRLNPGGRQSACSSARGLHLSQAALGNLPIKGRARKRGWLRTLLSITATEQGGPASCRSPERDADWRLALGGALLRAPSPIPSLLSSLPCGTGTASPGIPGLPQ